MKKKIVILCLLSIVLIGCTQPQEKTDCADPDLVKQDNPTPSPITLTVCLKKPYFTSYLPASSRYVNDYHIYELMYNTLVDADFSGKLSPEIAADWKVSPDGLEYEFNLRTDVRFHNGKLLTADDVIFSLKQLTLKAYKNYGELSFVQGSRDFLAGKTQAVPGLEKVDDFKFKIKLDKPFNYFLQFLSAKAASIIPANYAGLDEAGFEQTPIGSGPYKFQGQQCTSIQGNKFQEYRFLKNNDYFDCDVPGNVDQVNLYLPGKELNLEDLLVFDLFVKDIDPQQIELLGNRKIINTPHDLETFIAVNPRENSFMKKQDIRQLINYSLNREELVSFLSPGNCIPAHLLVPVNLFGHNPYYRLDYGKVKELEILSGKASKEQVVFSLLVHHGKRKLAEYIRDQLKKVNIRLEIIAVDPETYFHKISGPIDHSLIVAGSADYPSPYNFLILLYRVDGHLNYFNINSPRIAALMERLPLADIREEASLLTDINRLSENESLYIPLHYYSNIIVMKPGIKKVSFTYPSIINFSSIEVENE